MRTLVPLFVETTTLYIPLATWFKLIVASVEFKIVLPNASITVTNSKDAPVNATLNEVVAGLGTKLNATPGNSSKLTAIFTLNVVTSLQFPLIAVNVTVYEPLAAYACIGAAALELVMSPKSQEYEVAPVEVLANVATFPLVVNEPTAVGLALKVIEIGAEVPTPLQALAFVTNTVTLPVVDVTLIDCVVAPVDHKYVSEVDAVMVTVSPSHASIEDACTVGTGALFTLTTVATEVAVQPLAFV